MAALPPPTPSYSPGLHLSSLSAAQAGGCQGTPDPSPAGHDVQAVSPGVGDFVSLGLGSLIYKLGAALVRAGPSSGSE